MSQRGHAPGAVRLGTMEWLFGLHPHAVSGASAGYRPPTNHGQGCTLSLAPIPVLDYFSVTHLSP